MTRGERRCRPHHHHRPGCGPGPGGALAWRARSRLRVHLFVWFGVTIALSVAIAGLVAGATRGGGRTVTLLCAGGLLWVASGAIAWRLTHPLARLVHAAHDIGRGRIGRRVDLGRHSGELGILAEAMNDMAARIERQLDDQRALLAAVSHEIRTPLGHLRILAETARGSGLDGAVADDVDRELLEIDDLVAQLLAGSRLDFNAVETRPLDAADAGAAALERAGLAAELLEIDTDDVRCLADPTLLARALANLLANAASHGGGAEHLRVRRDGGAIAFEVDDAGPGFAEEELARVFEGFYRGGSHRDGADANSRSGNGAAAGGSLGLGLSLVRRIAMAHGGDAYAENRPEGGARVGFTLATP